MEADGYSLDDKRTPLDEINFGDIKDILEKFKHREKENPTDRKKKYFFVPIKEIKDKNWDLSISKYREIEYEEVEYDLPKNYLDKMEKIEEDILRDMVELRKQL
jgi:type I restriction enzyme M protein